eukprot:CAMPEP_0194276616 /NCGR_PEP_ID=MMETSP0169-20130528/9159_1 /TAXON_ID=218684 /ORGANISM="Corethron pennatum, Strain L29A3" /LENGTH=53 /DNA_ID=CAMNT_0039020373 /DNA_START=418 /DNA_END=579 /DNA_ORIENTATION=-
MMVWAQINFIGSRKIQGGDGMMKAHYQMSRNSRSPEVSDASPLAARDLALLVA